MSEVLMPEPAEQRRGRRMLLLLLLFFAGPLLLVLLMYKLDWHPSGDSRGVLVAPARAVSMAPGLLDAQGKPLSAALWRDKWSMVYVADDCAAACMQRLHDMRQLHVSLAKDIDRVQRVFIGAAPQADVLQRDYPDLVIIRQPAQALAELSAQFKASGGEDSASIYLVDPLGNLMMRFPGAIAVSDVRKDLTRLLRYAWAG